MTLNEFAEALDGLFAYDSGSHDSGIHDDNLKSRCNRYLISLTESDARALLARVAVKLYLSDEAIAQGYGLEDAQAFAEWVYGGGLAK